MGACAALSDADKITATYRGHGWVLEAGFRRPQISARSAIDNQASTVGGLSREVRVGQVFINGCGAGGGIEFPVGE